MNSSNEFVNEVYLVCAETVKAKTTRNDSGFITYTKNLFLWCMVRWQGLSYNSIKICCEGTGCIMFQKNWDNKK